MSSRLAIRTAIAIALCTLPAASDAGANATPPAAAAAPAAMPVDVDGLWAEASAIETRMFDATEMSGEEMRAEIARAADLFTAVAEAPDGRSDGYWHASRASWLAGELLPLEDEAGRLARFREALRLADRGLDADPDCAECMLWKFGAMGRLLTTEGVFDGLRRIKQMADLLERGIELEPDYRDNDLNSTLGNLHYASAVYYRTLPDWFWVRWVLGVRGDKERALAHSRKALALHPTRFDYTVELGTQLLCLGATKRKHRDRLEEGRAVIEQAVTHVPANDDEAREIFFARQLLEEPSRACGYTGDALLEVDEDAAKQARRSS